ncbi:MAG TPA: LuxR C-terminal-related transcriptional regulator [Jiangellaceae bacterium]|nr:LuxR C-terminal-related transcriptional regulator [Jiangellaceae bacterium]
MLATKLFLPRTPPGFVSRPRLVKQLEDGLARELVLVCAPAGFGKTALLADWSQRGQRPVAWVSMDTGDNDPVRFWRHVAAALDRVRPGITEQVAPLLRPPTPASFEGLVTALINSLTEEPGEMLLVLDDYNLVEAPLVHRSITFLLDHLPPGLLLVLASRSDPPLPLARLRGRGRLAELRTAELRFTLDEATSLLREAVGPNLSGDVVAVLAARSEGWAAGLQLAALSLRGQPDPTGLVATFSGSNRYILDYLTEEVLERQPQEIREFLLETSVLERLSGPLCDAVTGRKDCQATLETIERANLFLVPLDDMRCWWRYHHLFTDLLRARLQQQQPHRVPVLHRNAAAWSEEHGLADDAVRHALAANEPTWAARLIEQNADALHLRSEGATLQRWLAALPADLVGSWPRLSLVQARLALLSGKVEPVEGLLDAAERMWASAPGAADEPYEPSVGRAASVFTNVPAMIAAARAFLAELLGNADGTIAFASQALAELGEGDWMLESLARGHLAVADWLRGQLAEAERGFAARIQGWLAIGESALVAWGCHHLGLIQRAQGRLDAALATYRQALEIAAPPNRTALPGAGAAYVGMAGVAYQRGELDSALRYVTEGIELCEQLTFTQPLATGLATLAWIRQAAGDRAGAVHAITEAARVAPSPKVADLLNPVPAQRTRLLMAHGDLTGAARWVDQRGLGADDEASYPREPAYLVLARMLLAKGEADPALDLLRRLYADAAASNRTGSVIEIQALRALALAATGDEIHALTALEEALTLACPEGYIRVFADEGPAMAVLLDRLIANRARPQATGGSVLMAYLGRLEREFELDTDPRSKRTSLRTPGLVMALSAREHEVLHLLAAGKQNREIAEELYVTKDTVKKHVAHILDKLGAANRTQAVARARELGLLA